MTNLPRSRKTKIFRYRRRSRRCSTSTSSRQENAKRALAVAVYNHYMRLRTNMEDDGDRNPEEQHDADRTYGLREDAAGPDAGPRAERSVRNRPDATSPRLKPATSARTWENILLKLLQAADMDIAQAERGIIYIDEIDKISRKETIRRSPAMYPEERPAGAAPSSRRHD